jgi:etoposide-induced 2.4 mRNA
MHANPLPQQPYSPSPPVRSPVTGEEIYPLSSPFIPVRLPVFKLVIWINSWVIHGINYMTGGRRSHGSRSAAADSKQWDGEEDHVESGIPLRSPLILASRSPLTPGLKSRMRMN